jgi:hypothetical protein
MLVRRTDLAGGMRCRLELLEGPHGDRRLRYVTPTLHCLRGLVVEQAGNRGTREGSFGSLVCSSIGVYAMTVLVFSPPRPGRGNMSATASATIKSASGVSPEEMTTHQGGIIGLRHSEEKHQRTNGGHAPERDKGRAVTGMHDNESSERG